MVKPFLKQIDKTSKIKTVGEREILPNERLTFIEFLQLKETS